MRGPAGACAVSDCCAAGLAWPPASPAIRPMMLAPAITGPVGRSTPNPQRSVFGSVSGICCSRSLPGTTVPSLTLRSSVRSVR